MTHLIDYNFDENFDINVDETGDFDTNTGIDVVIGNAVLSSSDVIRDFVGGQNTATRREQMRSKVADEFADSEYLTMERLVVTEVDDTTVSFSLVLSTNETVSFTATV